MYIYITCLGVVIIHRQLKALSRTMHTVIRTQNRRYYRYQKPKTESHNVEKTTMIRRLTSANAGNKDALQSI